MTVWAAAVPDPGRPEDRLVFTIAGEVSDDFRSGIPWIEAELDQIREICKPARDDLSVAVQDALLADITGWWKKQDELMEGRINGQPVEWFSNPEVMKLVWPSIRDATPEVTVWCHCWTLAMEDDGKMIVDCDAPLYYERLDDESRGRINERLRKVNAVIGGIVERLMRGWGMKTKKKIMDKYPYFSIVRVAEKVSLIYQPIHDRYMPC